MERTIENIRVYQSAFELIKRENLKTYTAAPEILLCLRTLRPVLRGWRQVNKT